jgi:hypothetical protein
MKADQLCTSNLMLRAPRLLLLSLPERFGAVTQTYAFGMRNHVFNKPPPKITTYSKRMRFTNTAQLVRFEDQSFHF